MVTLEKIIDEIKQLSPTDQRRLFKILQRETKTSQPNAGRPSEQINVSIPGNVDLTLVEPELNG